MQGKGGGDDSDDEADVSETGRLFLRNLSYEVDEEGLKEHFQQYGPVSEVNLLRDGQNKVKGFGFITFLIPEDAVKALAGADGSFFQGRILHVLPAKPQAGGGTGPSGDSAGQSGFKADREAKRKAAAVSGAEAPVWNSLFARQDTLVAALAAKTGQSAGAIMDKEAGNMAVRVALGETAIIAETKQFLADAGISLDVMEASLRGEAPARSKTTLLVKNLPYEATVASLQEIFGRYGLLLRVVMPPTRAVAVVEYDSAKCAKAGFAALAYSKYMGVPLYLEWAPVGLVTGPPATAASSAAAAHDSSTPAGAAAEGGGQGSVAETEGPAGDPAGETPAGSRSLFVKNLNFATTEDGLRDMFATVGPVRSVRIPHRPNTGKRAVSLKPGEAPPPTLSMGYGFVEFEQEASALEALKRLQHATLDGHALQLKVSKQSAAGATAPSRKRTLAATGGSGKIMVKNVAFQATKRDIRELFAAYGDLKSVRVPKRFDGRARGFAFVEYSTPQEAAAAMQALSATHLYGRHLVLEQAAAEKADEELQADAADDAKAAAGMERSVKAKRRRMEE